MELTIGQVATATNTTEQYVRRAIAAGQLGALRQIGNTVIVDDLALQVWDRSRARGRQWSDEVARAALELLDTGSTQLLSSSERSRLRGRLRTITARDLAHMLGGLGGGWARYRREDSGKGVRLARPTGLTQDQLRQLGVVGQGSFVRIVVTEDLDAFEADNPVTLDASGNLGVIERNNAMSRARLMLDSYLLGDTRESAAAAAALEDAAHGL